MSRPPELIHAVDETPPPAVLGLGAFQHVAVNTSMIVYPMLLATAAGLPGSRMVDLVALSLLALGVGTILMCMNTRWVGSGYLCPAAYSLTFLSPVLYALHYGGLHLAFGMTLVAGITQLLIAPFLPRLRAVLPPEIAGVVVAISGLSMAVLGMRYALGIGSTGQLQLTYVAVAASTLAIMIVLTIWGRGFWQLFGSLIGTGAGMLLSKLAGIDFMVQLPRDGLALLKWPDMAHIGFAFDAALILPFVIVGIASAVTLMGNMANAQRINDAAWVRPDFKSMSRGLAGSGLAVIVCGLLGNAGVASSTASVGMSSANGITSRAVGYATGGLLIAAAFVPWVVFFLMATTAPVMGAMLVFTALFVFTSGLQMVTARMLDQRRVVVIGLSFAMAMMADIYRDAFATLPPVLHAVFGNGVVLGTACALILNALLRIGVRERVTLHFAAEDERHDRAAAFMSAQGASWAARRDVVQKATFCLQQALEVLGKPAGGVDVEASFDEFNLDLRLSYAGTPLEFPKHSPTADEIIESDDGEKLLAGYLLRGSCDRVQASERSGRAVLLFHFDH